VCVCVRRNDLRTVDLRTTHIHTHPVVCLPAFPCGLVAMLTSHRSLHMGIWVPRVPYRYAWFVLPPSFCDFRMHMLSLDTQRKETSYGLSLGHSQIPQPQIESHCLNCSHLHPTSAEAGNGKIQSVAHDHASSVALCRAARMRRSIEVLL
jgi:hypothetical protein